MKTVHLCLIYLMAFAGAEAVIFYVDEVGGTILYFVILLALIINSSLGTKAPVQTLLMALGLVPLIRIVSLAVPVGEISEIYWYLIIAVIVFAGILTVMRMLDLTPADVGLTRGDVPYWQIVVLAVAGVGFGLIDYFILEPDSLITSLTFEKILIPAVILLVSTGFMEELAFRGVLQHMAQSVGSWGWIYVAAVYTALQLGHGSTLHCAFAFVVALFFGWVVKKTGAIVGASLSHGIANIGLYLIWPHVF